MSWCAEIEKRKLGHEFNGYKYKNHSLIELNFKK